MNELVGLVLVPVRNSLILIGLTFRTFSVVVAVCLAWFAWLVHAALPSTTDVHCLEGKEMLSFTPTAVDAVVLVYVTVDSWLEPGANVCSPGGVAVAEAGVRLSACTAYVAATMLACTAWSVASVG